VKTRYFLGVLAFLICTIGVVSAETITLTEDNSNVNRDHPGTLPDGIINIQITYNPSTGVITYQDASPHDSNGGQTAYIGDSKIDEVAYNLNINKSSILAYDDNSLLSGEWALDNNLQVDGFGDFLRDYTTADTNKERPDKVVVQLESITTDPIQTINGNQVAVHLAFEGAFDKNGNPIKDPEGNIVKNVELGSTYLAGSATSIPEFPTVALPVAAILGLLLIMQSKRKEE
jgi:hypothetical protein